MKLAFVILQYMASDETIECIYSIRDHVGVDDYKIIVVDNASPDDSYEKVKNIFGQDQDVILLGGGYKPRLCKGQQRRLPICA